MTEFLLVSYTYRDADNYKTSMVVGVPGGADKKALDALFDRLDAGEGFVPGQIGLPDLQMNFNAGITFWDEERDHPFHEIDDVSVVSSVPRGTMVLNSLSATDLIDNVAAVTEWDDAYRPDFHGAMAEMKMEYDRDPDAFMTRVLERVGGPSSAIEP